MRSTIKSFFLLILLFIVIGGLYMLANPSAYYRATSRISYFKETIMDNENLSWVKSAFTNPKKQTTSNTPILMYHHVKNHLDSDDEIELGLSVPIVNFTEQMKYLKNNGYKTISLNELFIDNQEKNIVLTFDDGYQNVYKNAFPIMKNLGLSGTVFVITDFVGKDRYMNWSELNELKKEGWQIESHTITHPNLTNIDSKSAWNQILNSKLEIEKNIKGNVQSFSYPAGKYNDEVVKLVKEAGYKNAVSTDRGIENTMENIYHLKRERVGGYSGLQDFIGLLN